MGKRWPQESRDKMSAYRKAHPNSGQFQKGCVSAREGVCLSEATREKVRRNHANVSSNQNPMYGKHHSEGVREILSKAQRKRWEDPELRKEASKKSQQLWDETAFIAKVISGRAARPTRPERRLITIVANHFPEFEYNGNFNQGIMLNRLIPDFVNLDGKKELIEIFGDYFHSPRGSKNKWHRSELGRIMAYNSVGYKCLIIWEHELKELTDKQIVKKISQFFRRRYHVGTPSP